MPPGQRTRDVGGEAAAVRWVAPGAALQLARDREIELWLPTAITLAELADHGDVTAVLGAVRASSEPRLPEVIVRDVVAHVEDLLAAARRHHDVGDRGHRARAG